MGGGGTHFHSDIDKAIKSTGSSLFTSSNLEVLFKASDEPQLPLVLHRSGAMESNVGNCLW